jgi:hypothetical protein
MEGDDGEDGKGEDGKGEDGKGEDGKGDGRRRTTTRIYIAGKRREHT